MYMVQGHVGHALWIEISLMNIQRLYTFFMNSVVNLLHDGFGDSHTGKYVCRGCTGMRFGSGADHD